MVAQSIRRVIAWTFLVVAVAWGVLMLIALVQIHVTHTMPFHSFTDWVIVDQVQASAEYPLVRHSTAYYAARFYVCTFVLELLGLFSLLAILRDSRSAARQRHREAH